MAGPVLRPYHLVELAIGGNPRITNEPPSIFTVRPNDDGFWCDTLESVPNIIPLTQNGEY